MEKNTIEHLLQQVFSIAKKHEEFAKVTGENFNVFKVLGLESSEVQLHSAFLAELLSPKGSHGLGSVFLKLFVSMLDLAHFDTESAKVHIERHIGYIKDEGASGGRIDIVIEDGKGHGIIIENKIYAGDQSKQLLRYAEYGKKTYYNGFALYYLTLDGSEPTKESTGNILKLNEDFKVLSYKADILGWLEDCRKEAAIYAMLRETISQYINVIKLLTGQSINQKMEKDIVQLLTLNSQNIQAAYSVKGAIDNMERFLLEKLKGQLAIMAGEKGLKTDFDKDFGKKSNGTYLEFWLPNYDVAICFGFDRWRVDFHFGIGGNQINLDWKAKLAQSQLVARLGEDKCQPGKYSTWYYLTYIQDRTLKIWDLPEVWTMILDGSLSKKLNAYIEIALEELQEVGIVVADAEYKQEKLAAL